MGFGAWSDGYPNVGCANTVTLLQQSVQRNNGLDSLGWIELGSRGRICGVQMRDTTTPPLFS
jgi:hypothetical protein